MFLFFQKVGLFMKQVNVLNPFQHFCYKRDRQIYQYAEVPHCIEVSQSQPFDKTRQLMK